MSDERNVKFSKIRKADAAWAAFTDPPFVSPFVKADLQDLIGQFQPFKTAEKRPGTKVPLMFLETVK